MVNWRSIKPCSSTCFPFLAWSANPFALPSDQRSWLFLHKPARPARVACQLGCARAGCNDMRAFLIPTKSSISSLNLADLEGLREDIRLRADMEPRPRLTNTVVSQLFPIQDARGMQNACLQSPARPPKQRQDRIEYMYLFLEIRVIEKYHNVKDFARTYEAIVHYTPKLMVSDINLQD